MKRLTLLSLLLAACAARSATDDVPVVEVRKRKFARVVEAEGALRPVKATPVTVPSDIQWPLRITWLAMDGGAVKKGDVVARFDDLELKIRLANAEADRAVARAKKSKESLLLAAATQDRQRTTAAARRDLEMTRTFARRDSEIFSRDQIVEGEIDEKLQTAKVEHADEARAADRQVARGKLGLIEVEAKKADDAIERSEKGLQALEIRAAHDGVFTAKRNWMGDPARVGDTVWRSQSVADISLVDTMEAELFVLEAAGLAKGKKAEVIVEGHDGAPLKGEVKQVETVAKRRQPKSPTQYFGVVLSLPKVEIGSLKPGQRVRARLFLHEEEALVVPRPALFDREGAWIAYRRDRGGSFVPATVKLGASTAGLVTIASGLAAGDVIALRDPGKSPAELLRSNAAPGSGR